MVLTTLHGVSKLRNSWGLSTRNWNQRAMTRLLQGHRMLLKRLMILSVPRRSLTSQVMNPPINLQFLLTSCQITINLKIKNLIVKNHHATRHNITAILYRWKMLDGTSHMKIRMDTGTGTMQVFLRMRKIRKSFIKIHHQTLLNLGHGLAKFYLFLLLKYLSLFKLAKYQLSQCWSFLMNE